MEALAGVTAIDVSTAGGATTSSVAVLLVTPLMDAVMSVLPA